MLERYACRFGGVEINSSFYRSHRATTWGRWAASVPPGFRFAVKMPKAVSHERRLSDCDAALEAFFGEIAPLGKKLAVLLLQLPPSLAFDAAVAGPFFAAACARAPAPIACEPRHASWFDPAPDALLDHLGVARVAADPAPVPAAARPGGWPGLHYWRLHGSPRIYRSRYGPDRLADYADLIRAAPAAQNWCIFDNTAASAATGDALDLAARLA